jgi:hypothetical protein
MHSLLQRLRTGPGPVNAGDLLAPELYRFGPWVETAVITLIACALGWWAAPDDPLLSQSGFPWLWLAPVLVALRYGVMPGIFSAIGLLGDWGLVMALSEHTPDLPRAYFVGGVLLTLICGEFHAVWSNRVERRNEANAYLDERLNRLTRRYLLLRLSHDRIEQELLVKPGSLRDALLRLREINPGSGADTPLPEINELLALMAQYCQLEAAAVYPAPQADGEKFTVLPPLAVIGKPPQLTADDPMLLRALERHSLVHIAEQADASQLVVAPILTSDARLLGVLAVSHMPFFALNRENLQLLDLLLGYYADVVQGGGEAQELRRELPGCPWPFVEELVRVQRIQQRVGMSSHAVVFRFSGDQAYEIAGDVERMRRGLDVIWSVDAGAQPALAVLLPLSSSAASEGYILRIEHWLKDRYGIDSDTPGYGVVDIDLGRGDALQRLRLALLLDAAA